MPVKILLLFLVLAIPVAPTFWAILDIPKRRFSEPKKKVMWLFIVSSLPCIGALIYILLVRRTTEPLQLA